MGLTKGVVIMSYFYTNMSNKQRNPESQDGYSELYRNTKYDDVSISELIYHKYCDKWEVITDYTCEYLWFNTKRAALNWYNKNYYEKVA